jgi:hypothetical protein
VSRDQSIEPLSAEKRVAHYREKAMEAIRLSGESHCAEARMQFLQLAESWLAMAEEIERQTAKRSDKSGFLFTAIDDLPIEHVARSGSGIEIAAPSPVAQTGSGPLLHQTD